MSLWRQLTYGLRNLTHRAKHDRDMADEVEQYFEEAVAEWMSRGLSAEDARRAARLEAGNVTVAKERVRSYGWENAARSFVGDIRFAGRQLRKHPVFTATAALTLALGIGANAAIFTVIQSVLLAPLPYQNADRLFALNTHATDTGHTSPRVTGPDGTDVRDLSQSMEAVSLYFGGELGVQLRDHSTYTVVTFVDANFARVFNLQPIAGHLFTDADAHHAALVREQFARDNFGSPQAALGQILNVENEMLEITGVLPASFGFPSNTQVWEASPLRPESRARTAFNYKAVGRLRPGVSFQAAQAELNGISHQLETAYPENRNKQMIAVPLQQALTGKARPTLLFLWATVGITLLIACVNVTHLQLVRSMERERELAIRRALGSSPWQVMQPIMLESMLVSLIGSAAGVLLAFPAVRVLVAMAPKELPRAGEIHLNAWVLGFTLGLAVMTALASSLLPALRAAKVDPAEALKQDSSRGLTRKGAGTLRDGLIVAEVAATFVLAMGAGLLLHTMMTLMARDMGYQTRQLLVVDADAPAHTLSDAQQVVQQFYGLFARLELLPGVKHAAGIMGLPTGNYGSNGGYWTKGGLLPDDPNHRMDAIFSVASPGYFQSMGIPLQHGRDFNARDTYEGPFVAIISESLAKQSFGNIDPVGKQILCGLDSDKWMTIIGVVGDVRQQSPAEEPGVTLYMPMAEHPFYANQIHIVLRTEVKPLTLMNAVQRQITQMNPQIALRFTTMDTMMNESVTAERFRAVLISSFAGVGLVLAMLGVYGTMAYSVAQRTVEFGIRMAFGAEKSAILRGVLAHAAKLACCGIAAGLVLCLILVRLVTGMLVGVQPMDPFSLASAAFLLLLTAIVAAFAPGWKATHVDPMVALRAE